MVLLRHQLSSRKRPSSAFVPPIPPSKIPKPSTNATTTTITTSAMTTTTSAHNCDVSRRDEPQQNNDAEPESPMVEKMVTVLADAGCTIINPAGPPCLPSDTHKLHRHLHRILSAPDNAGLRSEFLSGLSSYIVSPHNLRRVLISLNCDGSRSGLARGKSLMQHLLLVPSIQLDLQIILLEKLPEYFDANPESFGTPSSLNNDLARLILSQFRWLDFLVDSNAFTEKLFQVLSICPLHLKKEIIGSLPEILGDQDLKSVVDSLEQMLQEDSAIIVPVLDSLSNLKLDDQLQEQVISVAISSIRTVDAEHMPYLLKFLLLSATPINVQRIISKIREELKFVGVSKSPAVDENKLKGKSIVDNTEASILDSLRSSLQFKSMLSDGILKELKSLEKAGDHKVIDIWLLMLIYMNGESLQKSVEKIFKKKIIEGCIQEALLDQCIQGSKELVQDYFPVFLSLSEFLLACKEQKAREFGAHLYTRLFEEFVDTYCRMEVLGALVTHVGSGISFEVNSALETMVLLASKYSEEMVPFSSHINGILDYLEGFTIENLRKVYECFSHLALRARSATDSFGSSIANELFMIVRKQVSNPDLIYKKMGVIGTLKIISCLGNASSVVHPSPSKKSNSDEALELLRTSLESCRQLPLPLILFYDELTTMLDFSTLRPELMEWISKHVGEFESVFLSDLEGGLLPMKDPCYDLEGELWMNLDGDISPICLNILPLFSSLQTASSLKILPSYFRLLSVIERLTNQGSLEGIDALLGCPLYLPSSKYFFGPTWKTLTEKQRQILCLSIYFAVNWIRELLNAFCTQVVVTSQASKDYIIAKLLKRLRNLVFLESLLRNCLKQCPLSLPEVHFHIAHSGSSFSDQPYYNVPVEKNEEKKICQRTFLSNKKKKISKLSKQSDIHGKLRQPTILDVLQKVGSVTSQEVPTEDSSMCSNERASESAYYHASDHCEPVVMDVSALDKVLEGQRFKFRPLLVDCFSILTFSKNEDSCCQDPAAELPLHLYLLRDLHNKLEYFSTTCKKCPSRCVGATLGLGKMTAIHFLREIRPLFLSLKKHLKAAVHVLKEDAETCQAHWKSQYISAGIPNIPGVMVSKSLVSILVSKEILHCLSKMLSIPDILMDKSVFLDLLEAFQPVKIPDTFFPEASMIPTTGNIDYLYCGSYLFLEEVLDIVCSCSFVLASEVLFSLESLVNFGEKFLDKAQDGNGRNIQTGFIHELLPTLRRRLGNSAHNLLRHNCNDNGFENGLKSKGEIVQMILHIYLKYCESTSNLLDELACSILPQVPSCKMTAENDYHGFPTLCSATFVVWYRVLHEENLAILNKLVKEVVLLDKLRMGGEHETVERVLIKLRQSVNVTVALVNMCRTHDKVTVHAMAVNYGGKFVDSFLRVFDFLQIHFQMHDELIIQLVKELQKATRTVQSLCSEAKGLKQTVITRKIPGTKRSMERFLFCVKALLHTTSSRCSFWMGNLKHKDLMGHVVSSQAYVDSQSANIDNDLEDSGFENQPNSVAGED